MKKTDLVVKIAQDAKIRKAAAQRAIESLVKAVTEALKTEGKASIAGLGVFRAKPTKERKARNPKTGVAVIVPPSKRVSFKPSTGLKAAVKSTSQTNLAV